MPETETTRVLAQAAQDAQAAALVPATPAVPAIPTLPQNDDGLELADRDDLLIPRRRVIQPTSRLEGNPGSFHDNLAQASKDKITCVLLRMTKSRVQWSDGDMPVCASDDAIQCRAEHADGGFGPQCATCPAAQWSDDAPPACKLTYNFLAADVEENNAPFIVSMAGANVKNAKALVSFFKLRRFPLYGVPVELRTEAIAGDRGRYYEIRFKPAQIHGFDWRPYKEMFEATGTWLIQVDTENTLARDGGGDTEAPAPSNEIPF